MSGRKAFFLRIEIDIHSVDFPQTRLDRFDNVAVRVRTFSSSAVTTPGYPPSPIHFHETLVLEKVIDRVSNLSQIQDHLNKEPLKVELISWSGYTGHVRVLADFQSKLSNFLFPTLLDEDVIDGARDGRMQLVMEPSDKFVRDRPRVEHSTKIAIEEMSPSSEMPKDQGCRHCRRTRKETSSCRETRRSQDSIVCNDCCICSNYFGYFGGEHISPSRCRSFPKHRFKSQDAERPRFPPRQLFYENLEFFYRQLRNKMESRNHC